MKSVGLIAAALIATQAHATTFSCDQGVTLKLRPTGISAHLAWEGVTVHGKMARETARIFEYELDGWFHDGASMDSATLSLPKDILRAKHARVDVLSYFEGISYVDVLSCSLVETHR